VVSYLPIANVNEFWANKSVLITGAGGFVGRHLCRNLVQIGAKVVGLDRQNHIQPELFACLAGDITDPDTISEALDTYSPTIVFHLAAAGASDPFLSEKKAIKVNTIGTINLLNAIQGHVKIVVARSPAELDLNSPYAVSKAAGWEFCSMYARTKGWPVVGAMIYQCYGPGQSLKNVIPAALDALRKGEKFPLSPGEQVRDWIFVDDVASGLISAAQSVLEPATTVDISTGIGTKLREVVETLYKITGCNIRPSFGAMPYRNGESMRVLGDAERTDILIGWKAKTILEEGLSIFIDSETGNL
jgi:nucleoside-diphosphate-sugar epimerase